MFKRPTTFFLGAGASASFGFPLGGALAARIRTLMRPQKDGGFLKYEPDLRKLVMVAANAENAATDQRGFFDAVDRIYRGLEYDNSIDDFLHRSRDDDAVVQLGKMAIAKILLIKEHDSFLGRLSQGESNLPELTHKDNWMHKLVIMLVKGLVRDEIHRVFENTWFVSFNYDRSFEFYLIHALSDAFDLPVTETAKIVASAPIRHAYGKLGDLPQLAENGRGIPFGTIIDDKRIVPISNNIRTYTQSSNDPELETFVEQAMQHSTQLVFLGCGYHLQNIELITPKMQPRLVTRIVGTTYDMSRDNRDAVEFRLRKVLGDQASQGFDFRDLLSKTCVDIINDYAMSLPG